jgi:hypothetical protein
LASAVEILAGGMIRNTLNKYIIDDAGIRLYGTSGVEVKMDGDSLLIGYQSGGSFVAITPYQLTVGLSAFPGSDAVLTPTSLVFDNAAGVRATYGGYANFSDATDATSASTGAVTFSGGIGVAKQLFAGTNLRVLGTTDASSATTGSLRTAGGLGVEKAAFIGTNLRVLGTTNATSQTTGSMRTDGGLGVNLDAWVGGIFRVQSTTESTSSTTGAFVTPGGVGIGKNLRVAGSIFGDYFTKAGTAGVTEVKTFFDGSAGYHTVSIVGGIITGWTIS